MRYLGPSNPCYLMATVLPWMICAPCTWKAKNFGPCGRPSSYRIRFWSGGMEMPFNWWYRSLYATSSSNIHMPALLQPIWALKECSRNCAASTTGRACARTSMPGAGNVKAVPLAKALQIVRMATFARSPPEHRWTWSPSTSCLAYLPHPRATSTSSSPLNTSINGLQLYPCATQKHQHACGHCITLFSRFGLPRQLHSDQGSNFESKLEAGLCLITGINKTRTTPFHPRSDGQTERANRTILQMLRASIDKQPEFWPDRWPALITAYRMTPHSVPGISPNMAMLGREVLLPVSLIVQPPEEPVAVSTPFRRIFAQTCENREKLFRPIRLVWI